MEIQKSRGIVLSSRSVGEADRLVRAFTREYGKRSFVFKGIRKSKKRSAAAAEPGALLDLVYYYHAERDFHIVNEFTLRGQHRGPEADLAGILYLFLMLEVVDKTTGQNDPGRPVFDLLEAALKALDETSRRGHLAVFFILHLLRIGGILPGFDSCKICGKRELERFALDWADLAPVCATCAGGRRMGRLLPRGGIEFIRTSLRTKYSSLDLDAWDDDLVLDLLFNLCLFIEGYFHTVLKSKEMVFSGIAGGKKLELQCRDGNNLWESQKI